MEKNKKAKPEVKNTQVAPRDDDPQFCTKSFDAETARSKDKDEPCKDGVG